MLWLSRKLLSTLTAALLITADIDRHPVQPGGEPCLAPKLSQPSCEPHKHLLSRILCGRLISVQADERHREDSVFVGIKNTFQIRVGRSTAGKKLSQHDDLFLRRLRRVISFTRADFRELCFLACV